MQISGLDIALKRMSQIESRFSAISADNSSVATEFKNVLNKQISTESKTSDNSSNQDYSSLIEKASQKYGIDAGFISSVIKAESNFDEKAVSKVGARGLMQLMPATAKNLGVENSFDPEQNIDGGTKYLSQLLSKYNGKKELALAAYNAGPSAVEKYGGVPPYKETQQYVKKILNNLGNI